MQVTQCSVALDVQVCALRDLHEPVKVKQHALTDLVVQHVLVVLLQSKCLLGGIGCVEGWVGWGDWSVRGALCADCAGCFAGEPRCGLVLSLLLPLMPVLVLLSGVFVIYDVVLVSLKGKEYIAEGNSYCTKERRYSVSVVT
jgi:hypothetical protein